MILAGITAGLYPMVNQALHRPFTNKKIYPEKTVIITGGTGNLASGMLHQFAWRKLRIILACRDVEKCKSLRREIVIRTGHRGIACRYLDLEDVESINKFVQDIAEKEPHVDILIHNAAVKHVENRELTKYGIEKNYFVNFLAPFLLTFSLYEKLKETAALTKDVRIINIIGAPKKSWTIDLSDINFDKREYKPRDAYRQSKLALAYFTILLDKFNKNAQVDIHAYGIDIGTNKVLTADDKISLLTLPKYFVSLSPDSVISNVLRCALDPNLSHPDRTGLLYSYLQSSFGWGIADKKEYDAKCVWNAAKQTLVNLQEVVDQEKFSESSKEAGQSQPNSTSEIKGSIKNEKIEPDKT